jgi:hypothetical protein
MKKTVEQILDELEKQVEQQMHVERQMWFANTYYPSFLFRLFGKRKPMPVRYVSREEGKRLLERLSKINIDTQLKAR